MLFFIGGIDIMSDGVARANKMPMSAKRLISLGRWVWKRTDTMVCRYSSDNFTKKKYQSLYSTHVPRQNIAVHIDTFFIHIFIHSAF